MASPLQQRWLHGYHCFLVDHCRSYICHENSKIASHRSRSATCKASNCHRAPSSPSLLMTSASGLCVCSCWRAGSDSIAPETTRLTLRLPFCPPCLRAAGGGWRKRARPQAGTAHTGQAAAKRQQTAPASNWRPSAQAAQLPAPAAMAAPVTTSVAAGAPRSGGYPIQLSGLMHLHPEHQHQLGLAGPSTSTPAAAPSGQLH